MSTTTPSRSTYHNPTGSASRTAAECTPEMRDRQARGKDPYKDSDSDYDDGPERRVRLGRGVKTEPFEDKERRGFALSVLDSPESLMMYALSAGDSVPGQRLRFTAMLCGFEERRKGKEVAGRERERDKERERERRR
ncbi:hypothetical protein H634G_03452 [Metarhizium anisopliae BRIP 53293]|uniref:Uncharacterized protein n=1 Tax=Metarhizium anisopliae BRIP 53293 TaxID=1291518 RepID=A0A0D9P3W9_METAN|nr:hypothetical protein H634G_03452 [Metarhizium anisopliae BRIP 53293]KJK92057.1 hypothetical protein H633G_04093 [Metarhizium anisopliae BRIP 53284]